MAKKGEKRRTNQRQQLAALLMSSGVTQRQTAQIVGVDENTVYKWKKQEGFKALLAEKMAQAQSKVEQARDILIEGAVLAALKDLDSLGSEDEAIALRAAGDILDRVGISKASKIEHLGASGGPIKGMVTVVVRSGSNTEPGTGGVLAQQEEDQGAVRREGQRQDGDRELGGSEDD